MADSLLGWCSAVFAVVGAVLVLAGLHHAGGVLLCVATVAAVGVYVTPSGTPRTSASGYASPGATAPRHAGDA